MTSKKQIFVRLGVEDIVLPVESVDNFNGYLNAIDEDGNEIANPCTYTIGYEFEDGRECDENGVPLDGLDDDQDDEDCDGASDGAIEGVQIEHISLIIKGERAEDMDDFDFGSLTMTCEGREFIMDVVQSYSYFDEDDNTTEVALVLAVDEEVFDECPYNIKKGDFSNENLKLELYVGCEFPENIISTTLLTVIDGVSTKFKVDVDSGSN